MPWEYLPFLMMKRNKIFHDLNNIMKKSYVRFTDKGLLTLFNPLHQPYTNKPRNKNKAHVCSTTNPTTLHKKLKMAPTTLPMIAGNESTAFPASLLKALLACLTIYSKLLHLLVEDLLFLFL